MTMESNDGGKTQRWIARQLRGQNAPDETMDAAESAAYNAMGPRARAEYDAGRPDRLAQVDELAQAIRAGAPAPEPWDGER